jgi:hypothetical protein
VIGIVAQSAIARAYELRPPTTRLPGAGGVTSPAV